jgi:hypothetical protein
MENGEGDRRQKSEVRRSEILNAIVFITPEKAFRRIIDEIKILEKKPGKETPPLSSPLIKGEDEGVTL